MKLLNPHNELDKIKNLGIILKLNIRQCFYFDIL